MYDGLELIFLYLRCDHSGHGEWKRRKGGKGIDTFEKSRTKSRKKVKGRKGPREGAVNLLM
jgi:hypothetical protein